MRSNGKKGTKMEWIKEAIRKGPKLSGNPRELRKKRGMVERNFPKEHTEIWHAGEVENSCQRLEGVSTKRRKT